METIRKRRRAAVAQASCVACGSCVKVCPKGAITIDRGLYAAVSAACIGCGLCSKECPASVISMVEVSV